MDRKKIYDSKYDDKSFKKYNLHRSSGQSQNEVPIKRQETKFLKIGTENFTKEPMAPEEESRKEVLKCCTL